MQTLTPELLWSLGRVGLDCVSPDGKMAVYGVTRYNVPNDNSNRTLYLVNVATGETRPITDSDAACSDAEFHPNGDRKPDLRPISGFGILGAAFFVFEGRYYRARVPRSAFVIAPERGTPNAALLSQWISRFA